MGIKRDDDTIEDTHESYGLLQISRVTAHPPMNVFGSAIKTGNPIALRIKRATRKRNIHQEWYHANGTILEIYMSPAQFSEAITTMNIGEGIPATIIYADGKNIEVCPSYGQNETFNDELKKDIKQAMESIEHVYKMASEILGSKGPVKVAEKKTLLSAIEHLKQHIESNMPFVHKQLARAMDKTVAQGKAEIEAFMNNTINKLSLMGLRGAEIGKRLSIEYSESKKTEEK